MCRPVLPKLVLCSLRWHGRSATLFARIASCESFASETPIFIVRQADSHESLEFPIRANHPIRANRANRFVRITPLSVLPCLNECVVGGLWAADPSKKCPQGREALLVQGRYPWAPRRSWKPGHQQYPGPKNQTAGTS